MKRIFELGVVATVLCIGFVSAEQPMVPVNVGVFRQEKRVFHREEEGLPSNDVHAVAVAEDGRVIVWTAKGDVALEDDRWVATTGATSLFAGKKNVPVEMHGLLKMAGGVLGVARGPEGQVAVGMERGVFLADKDGAREVFPQDGHQRWAPTRVSVSYDGLGRLWFASYQGAGCYEKGVWSLYTGAEGLP